MEEENNYDLKYPIGSFVRPASVNQQELGKWIGSISLFPEKISDLTEDLNKEELEYCYRKGGWNIRQIVHHCADSHMNSYFRFKWALTEDHPTIKPYYEDRWAELPDLEEIAPSLSILKGLHLRWVNLLRSLTSQQLDLKYFHPQSKTSFSLAETIALYAWHSNHHLAHIMIALEIRDTYEI